MVLQRVRRRLAITRRAVTESLTTHGRKAVHWNLYRRYKIIPERADKLPRRIMSVGSSARSVLFLILIIGIVVGAIGSYAGLSFESANVAILCIPSIQ